LVVIASRFPNRSRSLVADPEPEKTITRKITRKIFQRSVRTSDSASIAEANWDGSVATSSAFTHAGAFPVTPGGKDAALVVRLPPGGYTVVVSGAGNTTGSPAAVGTALVEIYDLDP